LIIFLVQHQHQNASADPLLRRPFIAVLSLPFPLQDEKVMLLSLFLFNPERPSASKATFLSTPLRFDVREVLSIPLRVASFFLGQTVQYFARFLYSFLICRTSLSSPAPFASRSRSLPFFPSFGLFRLPPFPVSTHQGLAF